LAAPQCWSSESRWWSCSRGEFEARRSRHSPGLITGVGYLAFGLWALLAHGFNPFFFVFIVPALLLLVASTG